MEIAIKLGTSLMTMQAATLRLDDPDEVRWVLRAHTGDETAYRWLMERYRTRVVRLAAHVLRRECDAEDIAQEAFIQAFRRIKTLKSPDRFRPWLFQIVVRLCLDQKRLKRWKSEEDLDMHEMVGHVGESADILNRVFVEHLLAQMSPPMRAALILSELEGMEYEEIAEALSIPVGTVRSRLNAARSRFREMWNSVEVENAGSC